MPQQYLRGFATAVERFHICMFDKRVSRWSEPAIKQVAQSRDYFSQEVEARLATEVENPGHEALGALRAGRRLTSVQRQALALYVAVLVMRVPRKRRKAREVMPQVLEESIAEARREFENHRRESNGDRIDALLGVLDRIEKTYQKELPSQVREGMDSPWPSGMILAAVSEMNWRILEAPEHLYFVTSDNPAHFFDSLGLGTAQSELTVPLCKQLCLHGSRQGEGGGLWRMKCEAGVVKELNRRQIHGAERFVFAHRRAPWILGEAETKEPSFKRILWGTPGQ